MRFTIDGDGIVSSSVALQNSNLFHGSSAYLLGVQRLMMLKRTVLSLLESFVPGCPVFKVALPYNLV